jgi:thioredoxin reductase (NADPH)
MSHRDDPSERTEPASRLVSAKSAEPEPPGPTRENTPVILAVDDDAMVLSAVVRDLRAEFGGSYRIQRATSGAAALEILRRLRLRGESVALLVVDQRMPEMTGLELLREAITIVPDARRVLLTAYADTEVAIRAINEVRLDHYLLKPWSPPEEHLYPVLRELLEEWRAEVRAPYEGVRIVSHRWSAEAHALRDFLARSSVPHQWLDIETNAEAGRLLALAGLQGIEEPVVLFPDGTHLVAPTKRDVAQRIGLRTAAESRVYDLIIVGGGPAGLAAAVYAASEGLSTVVFERDAPGGQAGWSARIENYLGFPTGLSGRELARRAVAQARRFGAEIVSPVSVVQVRTEAGFHTVELSSGESARTSALLIATGVAYRMLDVPGAMRLTGSGIYYGAAVTEALAVESEDVFVLGGGNSAGQAALYLSRFARSVSILIRGRTLVPTMSRYLITRIEQTPNITLRPEVELLEAHGRGRLEGLTLASGPGKAEESVNTPALFVFIGATAPSEWLADVVDRDPQGFILSGPDLSKDGGRPARWTANRDPFWLETSVAGIFVAGDVRHRSIKRVASAVGEGAMAVQFVHQHLGGMLIGQRPRVITPPPDREVVPAVGVTAGAPEAGSAAR